MAITYVQRDLDILNMALARVGAEPLAGSVADVFTGVGPAGKAGKIGLLFYERTVQEVLRVMPWPSVVTRAAASPVPTTGADLTAFTSKVSPLSTVLPDVIRVLEINGDKAIPYRIEGDTLLCNEASLSQGIRHIRRVSAALFDSILVKAIVARLASEISMSLTAQLDTATTLYQEYALSLASGKQVLAAEDRIDLIDLFGLYQSLVVAQKRNTIQE
jgi:hypothetical protein